jgi:hypothetical protein
MPSFRIGFGSDFTLKNQSVGIGTENPRATLDVVGTLKGDLLVSGVTTLTSYAGFVPQRQSGDDDVITTEVNTISEDIIVSVGKVFTVSAGATANIGTLESVAVGSHFSVPNGGTSLRPEEPVEGMVRFNNDLNTLEFYNGVEWRQFTVTGASGRGVFGGGTGNSQLLEYVNIATQGNSTNFGTLTVSHSAGGSCSSSVRGIFAGGEPNTNVIDYITIASEGNGIDFGDLTVARLYLSGSSSSTRGIFAGGFTPTPANTNLNTIDYIAIATIGNALDFGDLISATRAAASCASPTRSIFSGGYTSVNINTIQFVTISSTGNSVRFGELSVSRQTYSASCSSSTRGLIFGGISPSSVNVIDYVTIASTGNAIYFGDLTGSNRFASAALSSNIRGLCGGGGNPGSSVNIIDFVTIANTGNAQDFGDLVAPRGYLTACSDSHGGLGGF